MEPAGEPDFRELFLAHLPRIKATMAALSRRHGLSRADAEDCASSAIAHLVEDDYAVFRNFKGDSLLTTYLNRVLVNSFYDFCNEAWGRWRSSAPARRLGPAGVRLERLLYRDCTPLHQACATLCAEYPTLTERDALDLAKKIPRRLPTDTLSLNAFPAGGVEPVTPPLEDARDRHHALAELEEVINVLVERLPPEDALILRLRYWEGVPVTDIALLFQWKAKQLFRRLDALKRHLRKELEARGIGHTFIDEVIMEAEP